MKCPSCGVDNPPEARFCGSCSTPLGQSGVAPPPPAGQAVSKEMKIGIAVLSFFVFLVGVIMGLIYMNDPNPEKKAAGKLWLFAAAGGLVLQCLCWGAAMQRGF
jgi:zinc ribbon protein